ncbi:hypothetical protein DFA_08387 [Cavenderia fasciculata]|uniref:Major facilitator superfamily (MFS) profile domain-containing protein n=1 Tax=Cavenderia fasciculata TaxID=261658 RepID=F4Q5Y3_CACFS|nr:uncharacterized protein DFA_08387 [Cavenderia fasciculata]EGG17392.1 hypothetical protein DFA_08387 [Cavenderia fasciculata]|eukprot:XP_004355876.1 hypothetical protein DFA_08387 [Cavenderia fasciculata]
MGYMDSHDDNDEDDYMIDENNNQDDTDNTTENGVILHTSNNSNSSNSSNLEDDEEEIYNNNNNNYDDEEEEDESSSSNLIQKSNNSNNNIKNETVEKEVTHVFTDHNHKHNSSNNRNSNNNNNNNNNIIHSKQQQPVELIVASSPSLMVTVPPPSPKLISPLPSSSSTSSSNVNSQATSPTKMVRFKKEMRMLSGSGNVTKMEMESEEDASLSSSSMSVSSLDENDFLDSQQDPSLRMANLDPYERILNYCNKLRVDAQIYKRELTLTISYLLCFVSLGISVGSLGPTLLSLSTNTHSTLDQVGYFFSARGLGYFFGSFSGRFYDRVPNGNLICGLATILMAVALFLIPLSHNIWLTGIIFFFEGGFAGLIDSGLNTMIVWVWQDKVNPFMQLLHFAFGVGALLAPFLVSFMINSSLFTQYLVLSIIMFAAGVPIFFLPPVKPDIVANDQESQEVVSTSEKRLRLEVIIAVSIFLFFYVGAEAGYGGWIYTYSKLNLNFEDQSAALLNSLFWTSFTISRLVGVFVSMVLTPHQMVMMDIGGCLFFSILLVLFKSSSVILIISTAGLGISLASIFPTCFSLPRNLNMPVSGESTSFMVIGAVGGEITIPWVIGLCQHHISMHSLPWIVIITLVVSSFIYVGIVVRAKMVRASERGEQLELNLKLLNIVDLKSPPIFKDQQTD